MLEEERASGAHSFCRKPNSTFLLKSDLRLYNDPRDVEDWYGAQWITRTSDVNISHWRIARTLYSFFHVSDDDFPVMPVSQYSFPQQYRTRSSSPGISPPSSAITSSERTGTPRVCHACLYVQNPSATFRLPPPASAPHYFAMELAHYSEKIHSYTLKCDVSTHICLNFNLRTCFRPLLSLTPEALRLYSTQTSFHYLLLSHCSDTEDRVAGVAAAVRARLHAKKGIQWSPDLLYGQSLCVIFFAWGCMRTLLLYVVEWSSDNV